MFGIDPAISTDGDYNVITVLEVDENDNKTIVYIDRSKNVEFRENIQKVKLIGKVFQPEAILLKQIHLLSHLQRLEMLQT